MAVEIKKQFSGGIETVGEQGVMGADLLAGATAAAVETVTHPVRAIRKLERKGAPINHELRTSTVRQVGAAAETLQGYLPERVLLTGLRFVKERARRKDLIGQVAFRTLEILNDGFGAVTTVVKRMERASEPPRRGAAKSPLGTTARQARTATRKTVAKVVGTGRGTARRATTAARNTERKATATTRSTQRRATARTRKANTVSS